MKKTQFILSMLVQNEAGVLTRISGLFARRGYNIDSLSVGETENKEISRMTVAANGDEYEKDQIIKQVAKLRDVLVVEEMDLAATVTRELLLIKVNMGQERKSELLEAVNIYRAKVVDLCADSVSIEITGEKSKCDAFVEYLRGFGIAEMCRTGLTAIGRGTATLGDNNKKF